jgi:predicted amidohydrolase
MSTLPIALIQTRTPASPAAALAHVEPLIREAAAGGAKLILTPEAINFLNRDRDNREAVLALQDDDQAVGGVRALAKELGVWLLIGSVKAAGSRLPMTSCTSSTSICRPASAGAKASRSGQAKRRW